MSPQATLRAAKITLIVSLFVGIGLFLAGALRENIVYFKTPHEILQMQEMSTKLRLGGLVVKNSLKSKNGLYQFEVRDNSATMLVHYAGRFPDLFREGQGVVAIGSYDRGSKTFIASQLLVKHDQYYRPK